MHVQPISTFRLFQEGHLLRNSIAIFVLTTLFYFIGAELRLVHELSLFWPLNGVMAGVFARYVWLNRLHYYAISYVAMLVYDAITTEWGLVSLAINFSNMMFIVTVALLVARDKRLGKNKYEPVSALRLFNYCLLAALLCAIVGAIGSVSIDTLDFWPLLADWFSEQFSTGVLIVPCMLTLAIPGVLPRFKAEQMMPAIALIVSVIASVVIGGAGSLAFPLPALIWCAVRYTPQVTCLLTFVTGAVEVVLVANSVIDISVGSPFSIPQMFSARLGIATMAICPIMVSFSVAAINSLMKQVALRADFDFLTQVYSRSGLYEALKSPSLKQTQHLTVMLLDIDYFKSINDNYGHECGDKVLSVFAQHIQKIVGDKGLVARMGGEEFAVAVPSVNPVDGLLMAEKIRKGVELQPFTWQQKTLYLTVSFASAVTGRFRNPYIKHQLLSIALNGMTKFRTRILPQLLAGQKANGTLPARLTFALAALIAFYRGVRNGETYPVQDDAHWLERYQQLWSQYRDRVIGTQELVAIVLAEKDHWEQDLTQVPGLVEQVANDLDAILEKGMREAVRPLC